MSIWTEPSPSDFSRWEARLEAGEEPSGAARAEGFSGSSAFKRADRERHAAALEMSREARFGKVDETMEDWIAEEGAAPAIRLAWAKRWNGAYRDGVSVELTGPGGGPIELEAIERFTASVVSLAEQSQAALADTSET